MDGFADNLDGYYDVEEQLPRYLRERATEHFDATAARKDSIETVADHEQRVERVREAFLSGIGGLPDERTPLNARTTGRLSREGYDVETVVFESLPDFHVTATLYVPAAVRGNSAGDQQPGVLFLCGHATAGKAGDDYQKACIDLARNGFVTLSVDPLGQGERVQSYDPTTGEAERHGTTEHTYLAGQCAAAGTNLARYFVWDAVRALDYLESRPEVNGSRVGVTGNSGGGTQTTYLLLVDDRLDAAAPCCCVTSREAYMKTGQAQDGEQIVFGAIEAGIDYDDFLAAFAPDPLLVGAVQSDFFPIEGARESLERARDVYGLYGRRDDVGFAVAEQTHGLAAPLREAVVNWFREHLRDADPDFETGDPPVESPETLWATDAGQVRGEFQDETGVVDLNRALVHRRNDDPGSAPPVGDPERYAAELRGRLTEKFDLDRSTAPLHPRRIEREVDREAGVRWEKVFFYSEPDVIVAGILGEALDPPDSVRPTVVLPDRGTTEFSDHEDCIAALARDRGLAMAFDPRGVGAVRARDVNTPLSNGGTYFDYHGTEYKLGSDALMLGTSLFGMRVFDVLRAREYLAGRVQGTHPAVDSASADASPDGFGVDGTGVGALHALYAAASDAQFRSVRLADLPYSFHEMATQRSYDVDFRLRVHDVVGDCDVPQLLPALSGREVTWDGLDPARFR
jgi:hypothetical protein